MVIQHNISAINSLRNTKLNNNGVSKNLEKLSSGFRINRASDDAAGLAISEKMRGQIRGLDQASINVQDGISLINTADGAMQEDHNILQRIRELLVQGSNGTYGDFEKEVIQKEIDALMKEIDDLSHRADFNGIKVLRGGYDTDPADAFKPFDISKAVNPNNGVMAKDDFTVGGTQYTNTAQATIDFSSIDANNIKNLVGQGFYQTCCTCNNKYSIAFNDEGNNKFVPSGHDFILNIDITGITSGKELVNLISQAAKNTPNGSNGINGHNTKMDVDESDPTGNTLLIYDKRNGQAPDESRGWGLFGVGVWDNPNNDPDYEPDIPEITGYNYMPTELPIQAGANKGEHIKIKLPWVDTASLNIENKITLTPLEAALKSIDYVDSAINIVSEFRADMGAAQNRLEHALNNINNSSENLQAAESSIRDLDMAKEMMGFTKNNILIQASQSMLAQANQLPQGVLSLLR